MTLKKSIASNCIWIVYSIFALVFSAFVFTKLAERTELDVGYGLIFVPVMLAVAVGIVVLDEFLKKKIKKTFTLNRSVGIILPYAVAGVMIVVGLILRIHEFNAGHFALREYFDNAFVKTTDGVSTIHGASQLYYFQLRSLLMLFGNHSDSLVIHQIVVQTVSFIILFFPVKRLMGNIPALVMTAFAALSPFSISLSTTLGPSALFLFFFSIDLLVLSYIVPFRKNSYIIGAVAGVLTGFLIYLDITSGVILVLTVCFFLVNKVEKDTAVEADIYKISADDNQTKDSKKKSKKLKKPLISVDTVAVLQNKTIAFIIFAVAALAVLTLCVIIDLSVSSLRFSTIVKAQMEFYSPGEFSLYSIYEGIDIISGMVLAVLLLIGIPSGFIRKNTDQGSIPFVIVIVLCLLTGFSMTVANMDCFSYIILVLTTIAGETVYSLVKLPDGGLAVGEVLTEEEELLREAEIQKKLRRTVHKIEDGEMLDNPLPVPVKKKRKKLEYDYFVPDDAEYDL